MLIIVIVDALQLLLALVRIWVHQRFEEVSLQLSWGAACNRVPSIFQQALHLLRHKSPRVPPAPRASLSLTHSQTPHTLARRSNLLARLLIYSPQ